MLEGGVNNQVVADELLARFDHGERLAPAILR